MNKNIGCIKIQTYCSILLYLCLTLTHNNIMPQPASPQPGENIWHVVAGIGTAIDQLAICCATANSKIDSLGACDPFSITGPTAISVPGCYCLASNFNVSSGDGILITSDNIIVDLNNKTIFGTGGDNGVHVASTVSQVTIQNGSILNMTLNGILIEGNKCLIQNCTTNNNKTGINVSNGSSNRLIANTAIGNTTAGFALNNASNTIAKDNQAIANGSNDSSYGFISSAGVGNLFESCVAENTITTTNGLGFVAAGFMLTATESCSKIINCKVDNTQTPTAGFAVPYGIYLEADFQGTTTLWTTSDEDSMELTVEWSPGGNFLAAGDNSDTTGAIRVYSFNGRSLSLTVSLSLDAPVHSVNWSADGKFLAVGSETPSDTFEIHIYSFDGTALTLASTATVGDIVFSVNWSPDGRYLAVGSQLTNSEVQVYAFDGNLLTLASSQARGAPVNSVNWDPTEQFLAIGGDTGTDGNTLVVYSFDSITGFLIEVATSAQGTEITSVNWAANSIYLATGEQVAPGQIDVRIYKFDGVNLNQITTVISGGAGVQSVSWTQDTDFLSIGGEINSAPLLQTYSFNQTSLTLVDQHVLKRAHDPTFFSSVNWASNEQYLATGSSLSPFINVYKSQTSNCNKCLVQNNVVSCASGGFNTGIGINADTQRNVALNNVSVENDRNYLFVENIYTGGLYNYPTSPTNIQNISIPPR